MLKIIFIIFFAKLIYEGYQGWKMAGQKHIDMSFSWDGKEKPWDNAMREKYGKEYYDNLKKEWSEK